MIDRSSLVAELGGFARRLVPGYPVSDALHDLVDAAVTILAIRGAGVSLPVRDRVTFATASPRDIASLEAVQERDQTGPCIEVLSGGGPVLVADVTTRPQEWPGLAELAARAGVVGVAAIPVQLDGARVAALDLYDGQVHAWTPEEVCTAELLATMTANHIAGASRLDNARIHTGQLQKALDSRIVIEQAKGVIAGEQKISVDAAFVLLRACARNRRAPLHEVAHAVVDLGLRPEAPGRAT